MGSPVRRPSTTTVIESALDETIAHLTRSDLSPQERAILIEARRLRSMIASWRAIPPRPAARKEVFANALQLFKKAGVGGSTPPPPGETDLPAVPGDAPAEAATPPSSPADAFGEAETPPAHPSAPLLTVTTGEDPRPTPVSTPAVAPAAAPRPTTLPPSSSSRRVRIGPGVTLVRPSAMEWRPFPLTSGITVKVLHRDTRGGGFRALVKMDAGTELPRHRHSTAEEILMIEGSAMFGSVEAQAGELCHADAGSVHDSIKTTTGCVFFLVGSERDEIVSS